MFERTESISSTTRKHGLKTRDTVVPLLFCLLLVGCRKEDMADQPKYRPYEPSAFFADGASARPLVEGTVLRDDGPSDAYTYQTTHTGAVPPDANFPADFPKNGDALRRVLERGRERYTIYCAVCHGETGRGDGMIVQRGFIQPPAFVLIPDDAKNDPLRYRREQELQTVPPAHVFNVITNGFGAMYSYAARVTPQDRWAIAAYVRVLQFSQQAPVNDLPEADRRLATGAAQPSTNPGGPQ